VWYFLIRRLSSSLPCFYTWGSLPGQACPVDSLGGQRFGRLTAEAPRLAAAAAAAGVHNIPALVLRSGTPWVVRV